VAPTVALLINPTAGKGRGSRFALQAAARLRERGVTVRPVAGRDATEAARLAREVVGTTDDALVACGGDGIVHIGVQAVAGTGRPFGIVPAGTGNDAARALGFPREDPRAAADVVADALLTGEQHHADLARWTPLAPGGGADPCWYTAVAAAGFDSRVNDRANRMTYPRGRRRYDVAMVVELGVFRAIPYVLELDGSRWETEAMLVAVGNAASYGGGMQVTPDARMDDGLLDVLVLGRISKPEFLRVFPRVFSGRHVTHPAVTVRRARTADLAAPGVTVYADGERLGPLPARFEAVPGALRVLSAGLPRR
jgi:diacylglycerol kinase (ATP)